MRIVAVTIVLVVLAARVPALTASPPVAARPERLPPTESPPPIALAQYVSDPDEKSPWDTAWRKGSFTIVPYGSFWADMVYATQRNVPGPFTFWVESEQVEDEASFAVDARRSRLGLDVAGPDVGLLTDGESRGRLEIDFWGAFVTENRASLLLRHAYWQTTNDNWRLLAGQTWDVISPLNPHTVNYSVGWNAGNIGFRRAQFRWEHFRELPRDGLLTTQFSLNQDIIADFATVPGVVRESVDWPVLQGRIAGAWKSPDGQDYLTFGVSGHVGRTGFDFTAPGPPPLNLPPQENARFTTWSLNLEGTLAVTDRLHVQGELFTGANLSAFLGGVGQGVCPCTRTSIRSQGGWGELRFLCRPDLAVHVGYGLDDPRNQDIQVGRVYNQFLFVNSIFEVTPQFSTGLEFTYWTTHYLDTRGGLVPDASLGPELPGDALTIDWMVRYSF